MPYKDPDKKREYYKMYMRKFRRRNRRLILRILSKGIKMCEACRKKRNLDLHHETYNNDRKKKSVVYLCDLKTLKIIILCRSCHKKRHPKFIEYRV